MAIEARLLKSPWLSNFGLLNVILREDVFDNDRLDFRMDALRGLRLPVLWHFGNKIIFKFKLYFS